MDHTTRWQIHYDALTAFAEREGHTRVPAGHIEEHKTGAVLLGNWVSHQRQRRKQGLLSPERQKALAGLPGWEWGPLQRGPQVDGNREFVILELHDKGLTLQQIADTFHISRQRVHQLLKRARAYAD